MGCVANCIFAVIVLEALFVADLGNNWSDASVAIKEGGGSFLHVRTRSTPGRKQHPSIALFLPRKMAYITQKEKGITDKDSLYSRSNSSRRARGTCSHLRWSSGGKFKHAKSIGGIG